MIARRILGILRGICRRDEIGDDTLTLFCRNCHGEPAQDCTCRKDCGRPACPWPLWNALPTDREIAAWLASLATPKRDGGNG